MQNKSVSVITGVINESENIAKWLDSIREIVNSIGPFYLKEVVIVDDGSDDGTPDIINTYSKNTLPFNIILIKRVGKNGLYDSNITASKAATSDYVIVMDADLQHSSKYIPLMIDKLDKGYDVVIGSRYMEGGSIDWEPFRGIVSRTARHLSYLLFPSLRFFSDPLSGFFASRTAIVSSLKPNKNMTKTLLFLLVASSNKQVCEVPIHMTRRVAGNSKVLVTPSKTIFEFSRELIACHKIRGKKIMNQHTTEAIWSPRQY